jgi:hypothetical protein
MRLKILKGLDVLSNVKWDIIFLMKKVFDAEFRGIINSNSSLIDNHKGQRCFIVGNGPSLKKMDLTYLKDELVFTVNNIMCNKELYEQLNSDYHMLIDPGYFKLDLDFEDDRLTLDLLKQINYKNKKPKCLVNYDGKKAFDSYNLAQYLNLNFIYQHRNITDTYSSRIVLCSNIPSSQNVIHSAIFSAISMGFNEIYLIGCDMTSVFLTFEANSEGKVDVVKDFHAYEYTDNEKKRLLKDYNVLDNEAIMYDYGKTFTIFKRIKKYCKKNNILIANAGIGGGLDVFERVLYEDLFNNIDTNQN